MSVRKRRLPNLSSTFKAQAEKRSAKWRKTLAALAQQFRETFPVRRGIVYWLAARDSHSRRA